MPAQHVPSYHLIKVPWRTLSWSWSWSCFWGKSLLFQMKISFYLLWLSLTCLVCPGFSCSRKQIKHLIWNKSKICQANPWSWWHRYILLCFRVLLGHGSSLMSWWHRYILLCSRVLLGHGSSLNVTLVWSEACKLISWTILTRSFV